ncbi:MAG: DUF6456 domain-containing protein [Alphaproteobacteria bacterium]|nr:DUF6456 domain-containing protein [Alphaproteobacteria bacterium]
MTSQPSPEYRRHHDVEAPRVDGRTFHPGWRVHTRLDGLARDGQISDAAYAAGKRWRRDWEMAMEHSTSWRVDAAVGRGGASGDGPIDRLDAVGRLREAQAAVGLRAWRVLVCVVAQDYPWTETGGRLGIADNTARRQAARALEALARHYARLGESWQSE